MEITIDEIIEELEDSKDYPASDPASDEAIDGAIETMRKYEKIQKTYERFQKDDDYHPVMAWLDVMAVIEDGNN